MVPLTAAAIAVPSLLLFRACNDLFECWEVTRFYPAEGHLSRFTNSAEGIITTLPHKPSEADTRPSPLRMVDAGLLTKRLPGAS